MARIDVLKARLAYLQGKMNAGEGTNQMYAEYEWLQKEISKESKKK